MTSLPVISPETVDLRVAYESYVKMCLAGSPTIDSPAIQELRTAVLLSLAVYMAENVVQENCGCSVLDRFEVYFRQDHQEREIAVRKCKRIHMLPSDKLQHLWRPVHPLTKESLREGLETYMGWYLDGSTRPMALGPIGSQGIMLVIVSKGTCIWCEADYEAGSTQRCTCGSAYCCKLCQKKHWHSHKHLEH